MLKTLILKATHRLWNREISRILGHAYNACDNRADGPKEKK